MAPREELMRALRPKVAHVRGWERRVEAVAVRREIVAPVVKPRDRTWRVRIVRA